MQLLVHKKKMSAMKPKKGLSAKPILPPSLFRFMMASLLMIAAFKIGH